MSVGVETRSVDHKLHLLGGPFRWEELDGGLCGTSFGSGVGVGVVPIDVTTVDEATNQSEWYRRQEARGRIPTRLLPLQHVCVLPPSALGLVDEISVGAGTRVKNTGGASAVVILVCRVELA